MKNKNLIVVVFIFFLVGFTSYAEENDIHLDGKIRAYDFERINRNPEALDRSAFALSGQFNITAKLRQTGYQAVVSYFTSQPLGLNSHNPDRVDNSLPGYTVNAIGQAYLQYQYSNYVVRLGNQRIDTPWLSSSDSRMLPVTYQGIFAAFNINDNISLNGLRIIRFKSRTSSKFTRSNLYNPENLGSNSISQLGNEPNNGASALGIRYHKGEVSFNSWLYQFNHFTNLIYTDFEYSKQIVWSRPFIAFQIFHQWEDGESKLLPYTRGNIEANGIGVRTGLDIENINLTIGYNNLLKDKRGLKGGNISSPYTAGYASDPLYTTSMLGGLVEKAAGSAFKLGMSYKPCQDGWLLSTSYAKYYTKPYLYNTEEVDLGARYHFSGSLKGLMAAYRLGVLYGVPSTGRSLSSRIMLEYQF